MKITVIGHLCLDVIEHPDGKETQSYGGIYFGVASLANLLGPGDVVAPVFGVGKSEHDELTERLALYKNVDTSGIFRLSTPTNRVRLSYSDSSNRIECSRDISEPIPWKRIRPHVSCDMILINMISGFDITLETLDEIRMETRNEQTPIHIDVHCLTCGVNPDFTRFYRPLDTWRRWFYMLHGVQMNETEASSISREHLDDEALARQILALNTKAVHITRGSRGSTVFIDLHKQVKRLDYPAVAPEEAVDPTGCGDVFAAAYCAHYMKTRDIATSTGFANEVASFNARSAGSGEIDAISKYRLNGTK